MTDNWDASDSDEDTQTKPSPPKPTTQQNNDDWDASEPSDDEQAKPQSQQKQTIPKKPITNDLDASDASDNDQTNNPTDNTESNAKLSSLTDQFETEQEKLKKLQKKMQNFKKKQKRKKKNKKRKKQPPPPQISPDKNKQKDSDSSSSDSDDNTKNKPKMESYEKREQTGNDILFQGIKGKAKSKRVPQKDERAMLSGEVTLKNFPLGSSHDCKNLATQIGHLLEQSLFEQSINDNDVFLFYKQLLSSAVLDELHMVETKELTTKMNSLLSGKQKAWHKLKNPKNKKKKKAQWLTGKKGNQVKQGLKHQEGGYNPDDFDDLFD